MLDPPLMIEKPEPAGRDLFGLSFMPIELHDKTHIDVFDRSAREAWAHRFGVTEERLRKAVRMVGSRVTSVAAYLGQPAR